jgi:hypothetical protein
MQIMSSEIVALDSRKDLLSPLQRTAGFTQSYFFSAFLHSAIIVCSWISGSRLLPLQKKKKTWRWQPNKIAFYNQPNDILIFKPVFHFDRIVTYCSIFFCVEVISSTLVLRKQRNTLRFATIRLKWKTGFRHIHYYTGTAEPVYWRWGDQARIFLKSLSRRQAGF